MFKTIHEIFVLFSPSQRKQFWVLQILVLFMAIFELISVASIAPFIALASDIEIVNRNSFLAVVYKISGATSPEEFLYFVGCAVLSVLAISSALSVFTTWRLAMFAAKVGTEIADRLFKYYLNQSWLFHTKVSSSTLSKNISTETIRLSDFVIQPLMQINAKLMVSFLIAVAIIAVDPFTSLISILVVFLIYVILYRFVRVSLQKNGDDLSKYMGHRFSVMNEGFGGVKEVLLAGCEKYFTNRFVFAGKLFSHARGVNAGISQVPRYIIEFMAFGSVVILLLVFLRGGSDIVNILPILSLYAFAGLKLLPAVQQVYVNLSQVKGNISSFEILKKDLINAKLAELETFAELNNSSRIQPFSRLEVRNLSFEYRKGYTVLDRINLTIEANQTIGIVGPSGSGKSTLIDIILKLIEPSEGGLFLDDEKISGSEKKRLWQNSIGFVPQNIFLTEGTIFQNIAFGVSDKDIDSLQVNNAIKLADLEDVIKSFPEGVNTLVGERGVQLSGGQRQRIAIARALYRNPNIIVFDEATSALDGVSEKMIMKAINQFHGAKTVIMVAHRLKTVRQCDKIFIVNGGKICESGTYDELIKSSSFFREMALHA
jgi:ATP-binding cassette, subfamily B, bacterial PglK